MTLFLWVIRPLYGRKSGKSQYWDGAPHVAEAALHPAFYAGDRSIVRMKPHTSFAKAADHY